MNGARKSLILEKLELKDKVTFRAYNNNITVKVYTTDMMVSYDTCVFGSDEESNNIQIENVFVNRTTDIEEAKKAHNKVIEMLRGSNFKVKITMVKLTLPGVTDD